jgi:DNA processing protein
VTAPASTADWLRVLAAAGFGGSRWLNALRLAGDARALLALNASALGKLGIKSGEIARLRTCTRSEPPPDWSEWLTAPGHELIVYGSARYPARLAELADAPLALWVDGDATLLNRPQLAIVGSRHPTENGRMIAESFAASLSLAGITITSGLALGIDAASHRGALSGAGGTIAVLGNGIDQIYPASNRKLASSIRVDNLIVSEYAPTLPVRAHQFPQRNRIIAALSLGTLVVEATRRSGSLITARLAADYGREVFAVPGSIHNPLSKGCHKLLRDGAKLIETTEDILVEIAPQFVASAAETAPSSHAEAADRLPAVLANRLDFSPIAFDALLQATGLTAAELSSMLLHLEIQGKIEALPGGRYCRLAKRA